LISNGSFINPARLPASDYWQHFVNFKAKWFTTVPTIHQNLLKSPQPLPTPQIRFVQSRPSPYAPTVHQRLESTFNAPVIEAYAMTEPAHQMTFNPLPPGVRKPGSVGIVQGLKLKIKDEAGDMLPYGQMREVSIKDPDVTSSTLGDSKNVETHFAAIKFLRTGEQGYLDEDRYLFLTGRIKKLLNEGGGKISPIEKFNVLAQHPKVAEAESLVVDDDFYGHNVAVAIVLQEGTELPTAELLAWMAEIVATFKVPQHVRCPLLGGQC